MNLWKGSVLNQRVELVLPYPPTVNHYYVNAGHGRKAIGKRGTDYRKAVKLLVLKQKFSGSNKGVELPLTCDVKATVKVYPPDKRRRDLDNIFKCLFDALAEAGVYADDRQIKHIDASMNGVVKGGRVEIIIEER